MDKEELIQFITDKSRECGTLFIDVKVNISLCGEEISSDSGSFSVGDWS